MNAQNQTLSFVATVLLTVFLGLGFVQMLSSQLLTANEVRDVYVSIHGGH